MRADAAERARSVHAELATCDLIKCWCVLGGGRGREIDGGVGGSAAVAH